MIQYLIQLTLHNLPLKSTDTTYSTISTSDPNRKPICRNKRLESCFRRHHSKWHKLTLTKDIKHQTASFPEASGLYAVLPSPPSFLNVSPLHTLLHLMYLKRMIDRLKLVSITHLKPHPLSLLVSPPPKTLHVLPRSKSHDLTYLRVYDRAGLHR